MKAEQIFEEVKGKIRKLNRREKIELDSKLISESHPAFKIRKRGKIRSLEQAKQKLSKDLSLACVQEKN